MDRWLNLEIPVVGLDCSVLSDGRMAGGDGDALNALHTAFELGYRHFDTSDLIGRGHNETLLGAFLAQLGARRHDVQVASKFGVYRDPADKYNRVVSGRAECVKAACDASLQRLGLDCLDLYYVHRRDIHTPIEETMLAMADLVQAGKVRAVGLSDVSAETLQRAHAVTAVSAVQCEYSPWLRDAEQGVLPMCERLGLRLVAYHPLGRGLMRRRKAFAAVPQIDPVAQALLHFNASLLRQDEQDLDRDLALARQLEQLAAEQDCTSAQLVIAWMLSRYRHLSVLPDIARGPELAVYLATIRLGPEADALLSQMADPVPMVSQGKKEMLDQAGTLFETKRGPKPVDASSSEDRLYGEIGRLKMEVDWLKKSWGSDAGKAVGLDRREG